MWQGAGENLGNLRDTGLSVLGPGEERILSLSDEHDL